MLYCRPAAVVITTTANAGSLLVFLSFVAAPFPKIPRAPLDILALPQALERLIVSFAPYSTYSGRACRRRVLAAVGELRRLRGASPGLPAVQLWDEVFLAQIRDWKVAAFMLRAMLGIEVEVNLFNLEWEDLRWCLMRLLARKAIRRLYDT
ncbi:hypothetical protein AURDEDRAFT_124916 [Auricularia subglabra TFB-10046 SS5]|nr:hypothetical protein AURDEDRAFT_124916 [Auricularia subglabra TFB-10046 SS5]